MLKVALLAGEARDGGKSREDMRVTKALQSIPQIANALKVCARLDLRLIMLAIYVRSIS